ncbi:YidC/Oxa1 family membrane protein insertase [Rathayibacter soli]|uniref:YidC/Oxa1 family membrane protein insertase n=1 Tax=Rathayibacter soli TaxID=3144168 RepID=UPI0027E5B9DA|nr:membrane protein insertase YidC [Glaciibacter superstes]
MNIYASGPVASILDAVYQFVSALGGALQPIAGTAAAALAVVVFTLLVRTALVPVGVSQARAEFSRNRLAPQLAELQRIYGRDKKKLQEQTLALYAREKTSPLTGCLPLLVQAPVLSLVYALFLYSSIDGHSNTLLTQQLFGVPLGTSFVHLLGAGQALWPGIAVFVVLLGVIAVTTAVTRTVLSVHPAVTADGAAAGTPATRATRILSYLPFVTVVFAAFVPLAAGLYLVTTTTWSLLERITLRRLLRSVG